MVAINHLRFVPSFMNDNRLANSTIKKSIIDKEIVFIPLLLTQFNSPVIQNQLTNRNGKQNDYNK